MKNVKRKMKNGAKRGEEQGSGNKSGAKRKLAESSEFPPALSSDSIGV